LARYAKDLTAAAKEGRLDPVIGRSEEIRRTIQVLARRTKNNPCLIGEPGMSETPQECNRRERERESVCVCSWIDGLH
jgi:ATP-dependent Clp protease ATP-binding subunit ClpA